MNLNQVNNKSFIDLLNSATDFSRPTGKYKSQGYVESYIGLLTHRSGFYGRVIGDNSFVLKKTDVTFLEESPVILQVEGVVELNKEPTNIGGIEYVGYGALIVDGVSIFDGRSSEGGGGESYVFENGLVDNAGVVGWGGEFNEGNVRLEGNDFGTTLEIGRLSSRLEDCRIYTSEAFRIDVDNGTIDQRMFIDEGGYVYTIKDDDTDANLEHFIEPLSYQVIIENVDSGDTSTLQHSDLNFLITCQNQSLQLNDEGLKINGYELRDAENATKASTDPNNTTGWASDNNYIYRYTASGWGRTALETGYSES